MSLQANRLREYRRASELTQEQVADRLAKVAWERHGRYVAPGRELVSKFERATKSVSKFYRSLFCELYAATPADLGLIPPAPRRAVDSLDVERRHFAQLGALGLASLAVGQLDLERVGAVLSGTRVDEPGLAGLEAVTADLFKRSWTATPLSILPAVQGHLAGLRRLLEWTPGRLAGRAQAATGEAAMLAGHLSWKLDLAAETDAYWDVSERYAELAGHDRLWTTLMALRSWRWRDEDTAKSVAILDAAVERGGRGRDDAAASLAHSWRAAHAAQRGGLSHAAVRRGMEVAESNLGRVTSPHAPLYGIESLAAELQAANSYALLWMGRPAEAVSGFWNLFATMDPEWRGWRSLVLRDLGVAHAQAGEPEEACAALQGAWTLAREAGVSQGEATVKRARQDFLGGIDTAAVRQLDARLAGA